VDTSPYLLLSPGDKGTGRNYPNEIFLGLLVFAALWPARQFLCLRFAMIPREITGKTRGQDGVASPFLWALASPTMCRFSPALTDHKFRKKIKEPQETQKNTERRKAKENICAYAPGGRYFVCKFTSPCGTEFGNEVAANAFVTSERLKSRRAGWLHQQCRAMTNCRCG
jgi:hypothetical protein